MAKANNLTDLEYFFSELANVPNDVPPEDALDYIAAMLPHPSGNGLMKCSPQSSKRLHLMAERSLANSNVSFQLSSNTVFEELRKLVVQRFFVEDRPVNQSQANKVTSAAIRSAKKHFQTTKTYLPCHIDHIEQPNFFSIGPVKFYPINSFMSKFETDEISFIEAGRETKSVLHRRWLVKEMRSNFKTFSWIAEVKTMDCDEATTRRKANTIIANALNSLNVLLGEKRSEQMLLAGPGVPPRIHSKITENTSSGVMNISIGVEQKLNGLRGNWWEELCSNEREQIVQLIGRVLSIELDNSKTPQLVQRLLDAFSWYGEGVRDQFPASKIVKYVTAIERLVVTDGNTKKLTQTVVMRCAALLKIIGHENFDKISDDMTSVYALRSGYAHGSKSPVEVDYKNGVELAEKLSRSAIWAAILFYEDGLTTANYSNAKLKKSYQRLIKWAEELDDTN